MLTGQRGRHAEPDVVPLDIFVSEMHLPYVRLRKQSWQEDERIARQHLSPALGHRPLSGILRHEVEAGCEAWLQPPATAFQRYSKAYVPLRYGILPGRHSLCSGVSFLKIRIQRGRCLTPDEAQRLMCELKQSGRPEAVALCLLLLTGAQE